MSEETPKVVTLGRQAYVPPAEIEKDTAATIRKEVVENLLSVSKAVGEGEATGIFVLARLQNGAFRLWNTIDDVLPLIGMLDVVKTELGMAIVEAEEGE